MVGNIQNVFVHLAERPYSNFLLLTTLIMMEQNRRKTLLEETLVALLFSMLG